MKRNLITLFLIVASVQSSECMNIYEFFFGPKLKATSTSQDRKARSNLPPKTGKLIESNGYPFESHEVTSSTGHILELHRIPYSAKSKPKVKTKGVAVIHHGLLAASDIWLLREPEQSVAFSLADDGYDVWLCNSRGNFYSRKHAYLNPDKDVEYWTFSFHEMGYYDLPVVIDYVLNKTEAEKVLYIGHSMGSTVLFILCSLRPEYNSKISHHIALGPLAHIVHKQSSVQTVIYNIALQILQSTIQEKIYEFLPRREHIIHMVEMLCAEMATKNLCQSLLAASVGADNGRFDSSAIALFSNYYPAGSSIFTAFHVMQLVIKRDFSALDYENVGFNMFKYNSFEPPVYNLSLVTCPTSLHYGSLDVIISKEDIESIRSKLPNVVGVFPYEEFNHLDFVIAKDAKKKMYDRLEKIINKL